jgi:hypothetical protein
MALTVMGMVFIFLAAPLEGLLPVFRPLARLASGLARSASDKFPFGDTLRL